MINLAGSFFGAMLLTVLLIPLLESVAPRLQLVDAPGGRKQHARITPRIGGLAMAAAFFVMSLLLLPIDRVIGSFLIALAVLVAFGTWDDRADISYRYKFLGQFLAAVIVVFGGDLSLREIRLFGDPGSLTLLWQIVSVVFLVGVTNAVNLTDGLDGLAGGLCLLMLAAITGLGASAGELTASTRAPLFLALAAIGGLLGFLRFNSHPARVFMGDAGSQFLGFTAAALAIYVTQSESLAVSGVLPLFLLGIPIYDTLSVMIRRMLAGRSPFAADRSHIHYRMTGLGISHPGTVLTIYALQALLIVLAYLGRFATDAALVAGYVAFCLLLEGSLMAAERGFAAPVVRSVNGIGRRVAEQVTRAKLFVAVQGLSAVTLSVLAIVIAAVSQPAAADIGVLALVVTAGLIAFPMRHGNVVVTLFGRLTMYCAVTILLYLLYLLVIHTRTPITYLWLLAPILPLVLAGFVFANRDDLRLSPLDFLVLFSILAIPRLPGVPAITSVQWRSILGLLGCYYLIEIVNTNHGAWPGMLRVAFVVALGAVAARSFLS